MIQSPFIVRTAGLPAAALHALSAPTLRTAIDAILAIEQRLAEEGGALADELHEVIGTLADPPLKPAMVGLRRSLFRGRTPRSAEWRPEIRAALPAAMATRIEAWTARLGERDQRVAALADTLAEETGRTTELLLCTASDPGFRHGLMQSSPALSAQWEKWLSHRDGTPTRQLMARLARYVCRAAAKTSPYSTFTTIGAGTWTTGDNPLTVELPPVARGVLELHGPLFRELAAVLSASSELRPSMLVRANPSATLVGERLVLLGRPPEEPITSITALPAILDCLARLESRWLSLDWLYTTLSGEIPQTKAVTFVDRLIGLGVLELSLPIDDQDRDKFGALAGWLRRCGGERWAGVAEGCAELSRLLTAPDELTGTDAHRIRLGQLTKAIATLRTRAGLPADDTAFLHEHGVFTEPVATAGRPAWQDALADLDQVRHWLALHDPGLPVRLAVAGYLADRFGSGATVPFLALHGALLADLEHGAGVDLKAALWQGKSPSRGYRLPVLRELVELRARALAELFATPPDSDRVIRVDPAELAKELPGHVRPSPAMSWFVQLHGRTLVLNTAMSGYGRGRSRSLHLLATANGGELPAGLAMSTSDSNGIVADSSGEFGHTLNLRLPTASHELDYPFTVHRDGKRPRIPLRDLMVEHNAATGLAVLRRAGSGEVVTPIHAGMMVEFGLPLALQVLVSGLGANPALLRLAQLLRPRPGPGGVCFAPRIEAGLVVLRRATWIAPAGLVPRRNPGESDASLLLRLHRWLDENGIPRRCFVVTGQAFSKSRKPLYVDFASPWLVTMFERLSAGADGYVEFSEVLPELGADRAVELIVETTAGAE